MKGLASSKTLSRRLTSLGLMAVLSVLLVTLWILLLRLPTRWYEAKDILAYWSASNPGGGPGVRTREDLLARSSIALADGGPSAS